MSLQFQFLNQLSTDVHRTALSHGWWGGNEKFLEMLMLVVSEAAEVTDDYRAGYLLTEVRWRWHWDKPGTPQPIEFRTVPGGFLFKPARFKDDPDLDWEILELPRDVPMMRALGYRVEPYGVPVELADILIRVLDMCAFYGIDIARAMEVKTEYNETRPQKHGGKLI